MGDTKTSEANETAEASATGTVVTASKITYKDAKAAAKAALKKASISSATDEELREIIKKLATAVGVEIGD